MLAPPPWSWRPLLWEILDPPLRVNITRFLGSHERSHLMLKFLRRAQREAKNGNAKQGVSGIKPFLESNLLVYPTKLLSKFKEKKLAVILHASNLYSN